MSKTDNYRERLFNAAVDDGKKMTREELVDVIKHYSTKLARALAKVEGYKAILDMHENPHLFPNDEPLTKAIRVMRALSVSKQEVIAKLTERNLLTPEVAEFVDAIFTSEDDANG